jgi:hypothetical protein
MKKTHHSPIDKAAFGVINSTFFGLIYSLSMFNKKFEEGRYSLSNKIKFTFRNCLALGTIYGLNQFLEEWLTINKQEIKKKYNLNDKQYNLYGSFTSAVVPVTAGYYVYNFRNKNIKMEKSVFFFFGLLFFSFEYFKQSKENENI